MQTEFLNIEFLRMNNSDYWASTNPFLNIVPTHGSTRCDVLFSGALPFNWGDNDKPGLLSCKVVMRLQFSQHVPPIAFSPYSSTSEFMPHIYSDSWQQGILSGVSIQGAYQNLGGKRGIVKNWVLSMSDVCILGFLLLHTHSCVYTHAWVHTLLLP